MDEDAYRQALIAEGARALEKMRLERDDWRTRYMELARSIYERSGEAISGTTPKGDRA
jgi:hypothetical protein